MFERFDEAARTSLFWARHAVSEMGGASLEPEHLLLGLLRARNGIAASILGGAGLARRAVRDQMAGAGQAQLATNVDVPFSATCARVLAFAQSEADQMSSREITTGHLLLGLLREEKTVAFRMLHEAGVRLNDVRAKVEAA